MKQKWIKGIAEDYIEAKKNHDSLIMEKTKKEYFYFMLKKEKNRIERRKNFKNRIVPIIIKITSIMSSVILIIVLAKTIIIGIETITGTTLMNFINLVINSNEATQSLIIVLSIVIGVPLALGFGFIIEDNIKAFKEAANDIKESGEQDNKIIDFLTDCEE